MIEILAYALGVMYTPGPVNLMSFNAGLNGQARWRFCCGVACAMLALFLLFGFGGAWLITPQWQRWIGILGALYIAYLAIKIARSVQPGGEHSESTPAAMHFHSGLLMQLLNPKSFVAILPIVTVLFPAANVTGAAIPVWSMILASLAFGAPTLYMALGMHLGRRIRPDHVRRLNLTMALLLLYVAADMGYNQTFAE